MSKQQKYYWILMVRQAITPLVYVLKTSVCYFRLYNNGESHNLRELYVQLSINSQEDAEKGYQKTLQV